MKKTLHVAALGVTFVCLSAASSFAQLGGGPAPLPGAGSMSGSSAEPLPGAGGMPGVVPNGGMIQQQFAMPVNPGSLANMYGSSMGGGYPISGGYPSSSGSVSMPMLDLRQVVQQGIQTLPQQQRYNGAIGMANQNLSMLNQGMGSGMSPINQIRNSVRDSIMTTRVGQISPMGQATFRPMIQPGAVQSMISQIQPWNFPYRFQSAMMPAMIPMVSAPIKQRQMSYMQQGIMNSNFPNVPLPMPIFGSSSSGSGGYPYPDYGTGMPGNQGMIYNQGMMPGNQGMFYNQGMMPGVQGMMSNMQNMIMPNMQNMMMQNMMPSMMQQNMPYGYGYGY